MSVIWVQSGAGGLVRTESQSLLASDQKAQPPTFRSGVDLVRVSVVVRDRTGRLVSGLTRNDFVVLDAGRVRPIVDFSAELAPVSVALLVDVSGSMHVGGRLRDARQAAEHVLAWLDGDRDEAALFAFDAELREIQAFTTQVTTLRAALERLAPYGQTSLRDAIAEAATRVAGRRVGRRAVIVITDGVDTSSRMLAAEVSGVASAIGVPVYVVATVSPADHPGSGGAAVRETPSLLAGELVHLAAWTGGQLFVASRPAHASVAARQIVSELRQRYLIAFESSGAPGWHPLDIRTRDTTLSVRARRGYFAGKAGRSMHQEA